MDRSGITFDAAIPNRPGRRQSATGGFPGLMGYYRIDFPQIKKPEAANVQSLLLPPYPDRIPGRPEGLNSSFAARNRTTSSGNINKRILHREPFPGASD